MFLSGAPENDVLFQLTVTKTWLRQVIVALPLICHSSYRGVVEFMRDLLASLPRSGQNPKILGRDDTEVIRYLITIGVPSPGYFLAQEREDLRFEIGECRMTSIVGDMLVHQAP